MTMYPEISLYGTGGFLKKGIEEMNRKEKLAFVRSLYIQLGEEGDGDRQVIEIRCSRGISKKTFDVAREKGLQLHERTTKNDHTS